MNSTSIPFTFVKYLKLKTTRLEFTMTRHRRSVAAAVNILCIGLTFVTVDSLSTVKFSYRRSTNLRESHRCTYARSYKHRNSNSRLFSTSDFSSHPYSVYYGTSGSTAKQNFGQNDDINDVYGYNPDFRGREEPCHNGGPRGLRSMQDHPLIDGRRGARVFSGKYDEAFFRDSRSVNERDRFFNDEMYTEDRHIMNQMDCILDERDQLRRKLDSVVDENIYLQNQNQYQQNQHDINGDSQFMPREENQIYPPTNPISGTIHTGQNQETKTVINSVMDELKNMQRTVQAVEAEQQGRSTIGVMNSEISTVERIKSDLKNMEQELLNLSSERETFAAFPPNSNGHSSSTYEIPEEYNCNGSTSTPVSEQQSNVENTVEDFRTGNTVSGNDLAPSSPTTHHFDGAYEVVIKTELRKKKSFEGSGESVETQVDVSKGPLPYSVGDSFGSTYI